MTFVVFWRPNYWSVKSENTTKKLIIIIMVNILMFELTLARRGGKGPPCGFSQITPEVLGISL